MPNKSETTDSQSGSLANFNFDGDDEFFGIPGSGVKKEEDGAATLKEVKGTGKAGAESTEISEVKTDEDPDEDDEVEFFGDKDKKPKKAAAKKEEAEKPAEEEEEEEDDEKETTTSAKDKKGKEDKETADEDEPEDAEFFTTLAEELVEKGIFQNVELKKGEKISQDKFFELHDAEIEARTTETIAALFEELDDDAKAFIKFKKDGGRTQDFVSTFSKSLDIEELDENDDKQRDKVITHYLRTVEGLDDTEIADRKAWLKEGGKEKTYATKYFNSIKKADQKAKEELISKQEKAAEKREQDAAAFNESITEVISKTEAIGVFPITKEEQKSLPAYITKPTVKVGKNKYAPPFQAKLMETLRAATLKDQKNLILMAKLFKSDFDVTELVKSTKTEVIKNTRSKLIKHKETGAKPASSGNTEKTTLADFIDS